MLSPKLSAIGIAPLNSTIGTILMKKVIKYFTNIGNVAIFLSFPMINLILKNISQLYFIVNCFYDNRVLHSLSL